MSESEKAPAAPNELVMTRVFNAPRELVFRAFTESAEIKQWGGPPDYPCVEAEGDLRVGGKWRACLRARETGEKMWQGGVYREITPPERLVYTFAWDEESGNTPAETLVSITFAEKDGKTLMTFHQAPFASAERRDGHRKGWSGCFDRLDAYLREAQAHPAA